ncbi:uncharacterized protein LOC114289121 [Camellia sinensis]|uniref:uncharacterized protein LOC114289121 n=1 Tax=Camellia sinensis TaxID=4442 RepID=UPI001036D7E3|nr:uncharacterized protein LOC114289121 [Camellia sinensis]
MVGNLACLTTILVEPTIVEEVKTRQMEDEFFKKYNTKLRERSIRRRQNIDPILIDEIDSDDEWIAEKEDPVLSLDASWLDEEELFDAEAIRTVPITTMIEVWRIDQLQLRLMLTHLRMQRKEKLVKVQEMIEEKARQQDAPLWMKIWSLKKLVE